MAQQENLNMRSSTLLWVGVRCEYLVYLNTVYEIIKHQPANYKFHHQANLGSIYRNFTTFQQGLWKNYLIEHIQVFYL